MMYEKLVKRLRDISNSDSKIKSNYIGLTMLQAADAIEELSKLADAIPHVCECCVGCELEKKNGGCDNAFVLSPKRATQYLIKPRWIPVTERLPEIGTYIIAGRMKYDYENEYTHFVDVAFFGPRWNDADCSWQTFNDWCEGQQEFEITHWMPLPEPPKEDEPVNNPYKLEE